ncbi:FMN-binding protein [candidate division KSB3 bacterium]|jgi:Na+-transporting NADH:ubiquinone oxidoreductase subunit C|uniref:FMN-binding protein n=1 Tax=candidate division KSB3 bacterium TaxID=2044937 RepID=A0A9D5JST7_9BACT|nr:FMN-binding protein [candidate division KSB3 bacterium]MBD3323558.1 FMN-binding protein [candidate division KSB3 bacterium]
MIKKIVPMLGFILLLGILLTTTLVAVDSFTAPMIQRNEEIKRKTTILKAFNIDYTEENLDQVFPEQITMKGSAGQRYYVSDDGRFAFIFTGAGLWGPIEGVLSMEKDVRTIYNIELIRQEETPGLGSRIAERDFLNRFQEKQFSPELAMVPEGQSDAQNEVDSITGATMSSKALIEILNQQYEQFSNTVSGE